MGDNKFHLKFMNKITHAVPRKIRRYIISPIIVGSFLAGLVAILQGIITWWSILCMVLYFIIAFIGLLDWIIEKTRN